MKKVLTALSFLLSLYGLAQPARYSPANGHSHNDYNQPTPFWMAYQAGMGSIEADIFLYQGELIVSHDESGLAWHKTLKSEYLDKLQKSVLDHKNYPFADTSLTLQLLIDIKSDSIKTLDALIILLKQYPALIKNSKIRFVITGNRPDPKTFTGYPSFIFFDGVISEQYTEQALSKIVMFSDNFKKYSSWNGSGAIPLKDSMILLEKINQIHQLKKTIRFWNAPDNETAWKLLMGMGVDFINTDHVRELSKYLSVRSSNS